LFSGGKWPRALLRGQITRFAHIKLAEQHSHSAPESSFRRQVASAGDQRCRPNGSVLSIPASIHDVIRSKDHAHTNIAREFFETKQSGAIRQPGNRHTIFTQMHSQIVIPQLGNIAANRGRQDACAFQFGGKSPGIPRNVGRKPLSATRCARASATGSGQKQAF
jgi:hypothetical protein